MFEQQQGYTGYVNYGYVGSRQSYKKDEGGEGGTVGFQGQGQDSSKEGSYLPWINTRLSDLVSERSMDRHLPSHIVVSIALSRILLLLLLD